MTAPRYTVCTKPYGWSIEDNGRQVARCTIRPDADRIAAALNAVPTLTEACQAATAELAAWHEEIARLLPAGSEPRTAPTLRLIAAAIDVAPTLRTIATALDTARAAQECDAAQPQPEN